MSPLAPGYFPLLKVSRRIYGDGFIFSILNPKVVIFFVAFLPQFVAPEAGPVPMQLLLHGVLIIFVAVFVEPPLILLGDRLTKITRRSASVGKWIERALGTMLIGLGIKLALSER